MGLHKDLNNDVYDDMGGDALHLLPPGCVPITQEQADILLQPDIDLALQAKEKEDLIQAEIRNMAIDNLKKKNKLDVNGNVKK